VVVRLSGDVKVSAMLRHVSFIEAMDVSRDLLPRQRKRYAVAPVVGVTALLCPDLTERTVSWPGQQLSQRYMEIMTNTVLSEDVFSQHELSSPLGPTAPDFGLEMATSAL
jgi:hypothetical protein